MNRDQIKEAKNVLNVATDLVGEIDTLEKALKELPHLAALRFDFGEGEKFDVSWMLPGDTQTHLRRCHELSATVRHLQDDIRTALANVLRRDLNRTQIELADLHIVTTTNTEHAEAERPATFDSATCDSPSSEGLR